MGNKTVSNGRHFQATSLNEITKEGVWGDGAPALERPGRPAKEAEEEGRAGLGRPGAQEGSVCRREAWPCHMLS